MGFDEKHIAEFDAYLRNEMNAKEKMAFESSIAEDSLLKAKFETFKQFEKTIENVEVLSFKAQLNEWDQNAQKDITKKNTRVIPLRLIVAVAAITLIAFFTFNYFSDSTSNQELASNYFSPYDNVLTIRGEKETIDDALLLYEKEDYSSAEKLFSDYPENETANFYAGECAFMLNNYDQAISYYETVILQSEIFLEIAQYHLALAYLGADNKSKALEILTATTSDNFYYQEIQLLLEDLK